MELFTALQLKKLKMNGIDHNDAMADNMRDAADRWPVVRLTDGANEYLLSEIDLENELYAYGVVIDSYGHAAFGYVNLQAMKFGMWKATNDDRFNPTMTLSEYVACTNAPVRAVP